MGTVANFRTYIPPCKVLAHVVRVISFNEHLKNDNLKRLRQWGMYGNRNVYIVVYTNVSVGAYVNVRIGMKQVAHVQLDTQLRSMATMRVLRI